MTELAANRVNQAKVPARARKRIRWLPYLLVLPIVLYDGLLIIYPIAPCI